MIVIPRYLATEHVPFFVHEVNSRNVFACKVGGGGGALSKRLIVVFKTARHASIAVKPPSTA